MWTPVEVSKWVKWLSESAVEAVYDRQNYLPSFFDFAIVQKFRHLSERMPLGWSEFPLYRSTQLLALRRLGTMYDLGNPRDFNHKLNWLRVFGQDSRMIPLSDKLEAKKYVTEKIGEYFVPKTLQVLPPLKGWRDLSRKLSDIEHASGAEFVLKTSHDSGNTYFSRNLVSADRELHLRRFLRRFNRMEGRSTAEWPYWYLSPRAYIEQAVGDGSTPPSDFKFHCANGVVQFIQVISGRGTNATESLFSRDGKRIQTQLDQNMAFGDLTEFPADLGSMVDVAETLAIDFPYIRVDLYFEEGKIYFGEFTFFPLAATYKSLGIQEMPINFYLDTSSPMRPSHVIPPKSESSRGLANLSRRTNSECDTF